MIDLIKQKIFEHIKPEEPHGLFFSLYDNKGTLLCSNGVVKSDKPSTQIIDMIYHGLLEKHQNTKTIVCDIVEQLTVENDVQKLLSYNPKDRGVALLNQDGTKSGVVLPNTAGIADIKQALFVIKQKYGLQGNATIFVFKTKRIAFINK